MDAENGCYLEPTYHWQEEVENLESYSQAGYHPVHLGDSFADEHYKVVHKLRFGTYSTVWLARDQIQHRYVALKIIITALSSSTEKLCPTSPRSSSARQ